MTALSAFIETVPLLTQPSGIANYVNGLLREFARQPEAVRGLSGLASGRVERCRRLRSLCQALDPGIRFVDVPLPNRVAVAAPRLAAARARTRCGRVDIAHATANAFASWLPPQAHARVLTIHDVVALRHSGTLCSSELGAAMRARLPADVRRADLILTDSAFSKAEICDLLELPPERVAVAPLASSLDSAAAAAPAAPDAEGASEAPYLLYVGTLDPRKNVAMLLDAFDAFRQGQPAARLVLVGKPGWRGEACLEQIGRTAGVSHRPTCSAADLARLYRGARGTLLVSRYEGFGLPILEAMTLGCPVCYATGSSMGEIAGDAGIAVAPDERDAIVEAMRVLWTDSSRRTALAQAGRERAGSFTWARTAAATLDAYRLALAAAR